MPSKSFLFPDISKEKNIVISPSSHKLLSLSSENGGPATPITPASDINSNHTIKRSPKKKRLPLSFFSHKIGIGEGLGLQEYMVIVNSGKEDELEVWGYKKSIAKLLFTLLLIIMTGGLLGLLLYWMEHYWLYFTQEPCLLEEATTVLVVDHYRGQHTTRYVKHIYRFTSMQPDLVIPDQQNGGFRNVACFRYFNCKKNRYYWDSTEGTFFKMEGLDYKISIGELHDACIGLTKEESKMRSKLFGDNEIKVPMESIPILFVKEILTPFYIFQVFSILFWFFDEYWKYSTAILITSIASLASALYQTRKNQKNLRDTIVSSEIVTRLRPDSSTEQIVSSELVPGDMIIVPDHGCQLLCDAVLLEGQAIMDESMLTGESVPVTKTSLPKHPPESEYHHKHHEKHTLKCGTKVIQTRKYKDQCVKAIVIRTGYNTTKGDLVRSILYPPPVDFQFEKDSHKFIGALACIALVGMIYTMYRMILAEETIKDILFTVIDLITIVVPPALPAAMTIGIVLANQRLMPKNIFCISPRTINVAGAVDCTCFDKTGTITEDGMDMWGVVSTIKGMSTMLVDTAKTLGWHPAQHDVTNLPNDSQILLGMATCHELNIIGGEMRGDPLDEKMFSSTGWKLELEGDEQSQLDQLSMPYIKSPRTGSNSVIQAAPQKLFQFSSEVQRMSVITRVVEEREEGFTQPVTMVFCKGSPEMIQRLCKPETIPDDFSSVLDSYASRGFRIIALASKVIEAQNAKVAKLNKLTREQVESDLEFLGLIIMENRLKAASVEVIKELKNACIRTIMVTGDNILTAVSVARDCGIVPHGEDIIRCKAEMIDENTPKVTWVKLQDRSGNSNGVILDSKEIKLRMESKQYHLAVDGASFDIICDYCRDSVLPYLATRGAVFARMRPEMKQRLVEILQDLDYKVIMCGDGANDCGALKAANAGISLSEAEASVASPFTSKTPDISCVPILIRESRCALVTAFGIFKYMACYSLTQFVTVIILYEIFANLSDMQFLWIDLFIITTLAAVYGYTKAYEGPLAKEPPMSSLISIVPLFSLVSQMAVVIAFQLAAWFFVRAQPWYVEFDYESPCYNGTAAIDNFMRQEMNESYAGCDPSDFPTASYENFALYNVSQFQYIILIITFSKGTPYRQNFYKNIPLVFDILALGSFSLFMSVWPDFWPACAKYFEQFAPPLEYFEFRWYIIALVAANLVFSVFTESVLANMVVKKMVSGKKKKHELIDRELDSRRDWPPLSPDTPDFSPKGSGSSENIDSQGRVLIMKSDKAESKDRAFESLLSTPGSNKDTPSHVAAAVCLNPPIQTNRNQRVDMLMASPKSYTTAHSSPTTSNSSNTCKFVSCNTLDGQEEVELDR